MRSLSLHISTDMEFTINVNYVKHVTCNNEFKSSI